MSPLLFSFLTIFVAGARCTTEIGCYFRMFTTF
uniref:Uncharacterized protein n=1 Tax=Anguilla anguilla TaxID=7936 RepID=A0A0E9UB68_ANGAN